MRTDRARHLVFLAHIWALSPFLLVWVFRPDLLTIHRNPAVAVPLQLFWTVALVYLVGRTVLAWISPRWLRWDYLFPVVDLLLVASALNLRGAPDSSILFLFLLPIAEAASTLNLRWAALVGVLAVLGALEATWGLPSSGVFGAAFRLFFLVVIASLFTWLARIAADLRAEYSLAAERNRIALEMHDGVQALLMTISSQLELARRVAPEDGVRAAEITGESRVLTQQAAAELRFLVGRLRSPGPGRGFLPALQHYVQHFARRHDLDLEFTVDGEEYRLQPETEHALFRIVQESLNNVVKHSGASGVAVRVEFGPGSVRCAVMDNGNGLLGEEPGRAAGSSGLAGMQERAQAVGATLSVSSAPGGGTAVEVAVPCTRRQEAVKWWSWGGLEG